MTEMESCTFTTGDLKAPVQLFPLVRHFSYRLTPLLLQWPLTPNQITLISLLLGLAGAACFLGGGWFPGVMGGFLLVACYTFDNCDGEVARIKGLSSEFGARLDDFSDSMVDLSFFVARRTDGGMRWTLANPEPFTLTRAARRSAVTAA